MLCCILDILKNPSEPSPILILLKFSAVSTRLATSSSLKCVLSCLFILTWKSLSFIPTSLTSHSLSSSLCILILSFRHAGVPQVSAFGLLLSSFYTFFTSYFIHICSFSGYFQMIGKFIFTAEIIHLNSRSL